jgi:pyrimidine-specific ribonucleoside hydrolase
MELIARGISTLSALAWVALSCTTLWGAEPSTPIDVWLDVDTATGSGDVDDGLMLIQSFHSPEMKIHGVSVVYGNAPLDKAVPIAREIVSKFGPQGMPVHAGAARSDQLGEITPAVKAMAAALKQQPLTILAVGPVTNVGTLVQRYPELHGRIQSIIMVAARRKDQRFISSERQKLPHRDFNFEHDPVAMQAILDTKIPLVFAPWEVSSHVWITRDDLQTLKQSGPSGQWIAETSQYWIARWEAGITDRGFNPFDTLAAGWVTHPHLIRSMRVGVNIIEGPDDRDGDKTKPYLVVEPTTETSREVIFCFQPEDAFKPLLMQRLAGQSGS